MKPPWFTKLAALAAVVLLLLFGLGLIEDVVRGRRRYRGLTARARDRRALSAESLFTISREIVNRLSAKACRRRAQRRSGC